MNPCRLVLSPRPHTRSKSGAALLVAVDVGVVKLLGDQCVLVERRRDLISVEIAGLQRSQDTRSRHREIGLNRVAVDVVQRDFAEVVDGLQGRSHVHVFGRRSLHDQGERVLELALPLELIAILVARVDVDLVEHRVDRGLLKGRLVAAGERDVSDLLDKAIDNPLNPIDSGIEDIDLTPSWASSPLNRAPYQPSSTRAHRRGFARSLAAPAGLPSAASKASTSPPRALAITRAMRSTSRSSAGPARHRGPCERGRRDPL